MKYRFVAVVVILSISSLLFANVKLPAIISNNMVLQQDMDVRIWGWADRGEEILITPQWPNCSAKAMTADDKGHWSTFIKTPKAGGPYNITIKGNNTIELKNVLIGEVWLCSGQSNMNLRMKGEDKQPIHNGPEDIKNSANKSIRLFTVPRKLSDTPLSDVNSCWVECSPETVKNFSAVGYYFGRKIQKETGYPVGLICSAVGATLAQAWTNINFMKYNDNLSNMIDEYDAKIKKWEMACFEAKKLQKPEPSRPVRDQHKPGVLYNGMIAPITNMTIKGVIWYQGESNEGAAYLYRDLFPTLIRNWRCDFNNFDMPFYFVQLAGFTVHKPGIKVEPYRGEPRENDWAELREAQFMTTSMKNTGMAVTIDIGETNNIHPGNKTDVGERLAFWALAKDYGKNIEYSGPLYAGYKIEGDKIRIMFSHNSGLVFKNDKPKGFAIAGKDRKFVWADAKIDGTTVLVSSDTVKEPVSVRYAWDKDPEISLYNKANLPASPFRTDSWNGITYGNLKGI